MKTISDLPDDLIGEIFSWVPITSLSVLRCTCRRWNDVSKTWVVGKKPASNQQFLEFMLVDYKVCSYRFQLQQEISNFRDQIFIDASVKNIGKLEDVVVSQVSQCDGLLLCVTKDHSGLLVWNSYLGQTRWIQPTRNNLPMTYERYVLGYDDNKNNRNHKIVRFLFNGWEAEEYHIEVHNLSSNDAWRVLDPSSDWENPIYYTHVSLKGNTYFLGGGEVTQRHLLCFDFTTERFGPHLSLPLQPVYSAADNVTLSCVRDEKLIVLCKHYRTSERIKIWISTKIEPNTVTWSMFFKVDINNLPRDFPNYFGDFSFFLDEEKKVAVLFHPAYRMFHKRACIIGEDRFIGDINIGQSNNARWDYSRLVGSSYVPSLVQLNVNQPWRKRKERDD